MKGTDKGGMFCSVMIFDVAVLASHFFFWPFLRETMKKTEKGLYSKERREYRQKFYNLPIWRRIRAVQLRRAPFCEICYNSIPRKLELATVCDHFKGWNTYKEFVKGPFLSLCHACHNEKTIADLRKMRKKEKTTLEVLDV